MCECAKSNTLIKEAAVIFAVKAFDMWRSYFMTFYLTFIALALTWSIIAYASHPGNVGWYASIVAQSIFLLWFTYLKTMKLSNAFFASIVVTASGGAATLIAAGNFVIIDRNNATPLLLVGIGYLGWLIYHFAYAHVVRYRGNIKMGDHLPMAELINSEGHVVSTNKLRFPAVIVFHEGKWNPLATDQLRELAVASSDFMRQRIHLYAVSTQVATDRWDHALIELSDPDGEWIHQCGILARRRLPIGLGFFGYKTDIPEPFAIITGSDGKVIGVHKPIDTRRRPSAAFFLRYFNT